MSILFDFCGIITDRFVETGTFEGMSLENACKFFKECLSVEIDFKTYREAFLRFENVQNVKIYNDNSPHFLRKVLDHRVRTTFWLDAHYHERPLPLHVKQCPLLEELYEITRLSWWYSPIILIDDASIFMSDAQFVQHPGHWKREEWPTIEQIDSMLLGYQRTMRGEAVMYKVP